MQFERLKKTFSPQLSIESNLLTPEVGFKTAVNERSREIRLTLTSARHLPNNYGKNPVHGYIFKVKLFPGKDKFETELRSESWPKFNQNFNFKLGKAQQGFGGRFLVITAYAILEHQNVKPEPSDESRIDKWKRVYDEKVVKLFHKNSKKEHTKEIRGTNLTFERRRNVGSVTILLDKEKFLNDVGHNWISSEEIWRPLQNLSGGIIENDTKDNEGKKGELEIGLFYEKSPDGQSCNFIFSLQKMRCNIHLMQLQENVAETLYIKMRILNKNEIIEKGKTKKFAPSISHNFDSAAHLKSSVHITDLEGISFQISLMGRNRKGDKLTLGTINLSSTSKGNYLKQWEKSLESAGKNIVQWQYLE